MKINASISQLQFAFIVFNTAFGSGALTFSRKVAEVAKEDMWLSVIIGGLWFLIAFLMAAKLSSYFPNLTCLEYYQVLLGRGLGLLLGLCFLLLLINIAGVSLRLFTATIKLIILDMTPDTVVVISFLTLAFYLCQYGLMPLIRFQQFLLFGYIPFFALILLGFSAVKTNNFLPFFAEGLLPVLKGSYSVWFSYTGPELLITLLFPFITHPDKIYKWGSATIGLLTIAYSILTVITQGILGPVEVSYILNPPIIAYREVDLPDTFIERLEGYVMLMWIPVYFNSLANFTYFAQVGFKKLLGLESTRPITPFLVPILYLIAFFPNTTNDIFFLNDLVSIASIVWSLILTPCLLCLAWLHKRRCSSNE